MHSLTLPRCHRAAVADIYVHFHTFLPKVTLNDKRSITAECACRFMSFAALTAPQLNERATSNSDRPTGPTDRGGGGFRLKKRPRKSTQQCLRRPLPLPLPPPSSSTSVTAPLEFPACLPAMPVCPPSANPRFHPYHPIRVRQRWPCCMALALQRGQHFFPQGPRRRRGGGAADGGGIIFTVRRSRRARRPCGQLGARRICRRSDQSSVILGRAFCKPTYRPVATLCFCHTDFNKRVMVLQISMAASEVKSEL